MTRCDVLVVGGGLAGMLAAATLACAGRSVVLVERLPRLGGRCGTFALDGHRFTIGCNDFGSRIARDLAAVGVDVGFEPSTNVVDLGDWTTKVPPSPLGALRLLRHAPAVARLAWRVRRGGRSFLGELYAPEERDDVGYRFASLIAYATGTPPSALRADLLRADFGPAYGYGHDRTVVPIGGPQTVTDALAARLAALGVVVWTATAVDGRPERTADGFVASTAQGPLAARAVLTSAARDGDRPGLSAAQILWEAPADVPFVDARALIASPPSPERWLGELDRGGWPEGPGFHLFRDQRGPGTQTFTGFVLAPRGQPRFDAATRERLFDRIETVVERHAPGFRAAVRYRRMLDPTEFTAIHGLSSALAGPIPTADDDPWPVEVEAGRYRMGNGFGPPGEHANAAMLSALWAAERALGHLDGRAT